MLKHRAQRKRTRGGIRELGFLPRRGSAGRLWPHLECSSGSRRRARGRRSDNHLGGSVCQRALSAQLTIGRTSSRAHAWRILAPDVISVCKSAKWKPRNGDGSQRTVCAVARLGASLLKFYRLRIDVFFEVPTLQAETRSSAALRSFHSVTSAEPESHWLADQLLHKVRAC